MKYTKLFIGAMLMAAAATASAAVTPIGKKVDIVFTSTDGVFSGDFGNTFFAADKGKTFLDTYMFSLKGLSDVDAAVTSIATISRGVTRLDLGITGFGLYAGTNSVAQGTVDEFGKIDLRTMTLTDLASGAYSLQVSGTVLGTSGGSYGGNLNVSPVPEPETWGMFGTGLLITGYLSRRRKAGAKKSNVVTA